MSWGEWADAGVRWVITCAAILAGILGRAGIRLGGNPPPDDPVLYAKWRRRQLCVACGEALSLPAFGALWVLADRYFVLQPEALIAGCIVTGALGFGFCLEGVQRLVNRRIDNA